VAGSDLTSTWSRVPHSVAVIRCAAVVGIVARAASLSLAALGVYALRDIFRQRCSERGRAFAAGAPLPSRTRGSSELCEVHNGPRSLPNLRNLRFVKQSHFAFGPQAIMIGRPETV